MACRMPGCEISLACVSLAGGMLINARNAPQPLGGRERGVVSFAPPFAESPTPLILRQTKLFQHLARSSPNTCPWTRVSSWLAGVDRRLAAVLFAALSNNLFAPLAWMKRIGSVHPSHHLPEGSRGSLLRNLKGPQSYIDIPTTTAKPPTLSPSVPASKYQLSPSLQPHTTSLYSTLFSSLLSFSSFLPPTFDFLDCFPSYSYLANKP